MGEVTNISWCDHTINWWIGCMKVSPACDGCYAEAMMDKRYHRVEWGAPAQGAGSRSRTSKSTWDAPLKWNRKAEAEGTRPFVFSSSLSDIFDNQVPAEWRRDAFEVMRKTPNLVYLLLTKRPQNIIKLAEAAGGLPRNAAIGTTVEDQQRADLNVPALLKAKETIRPIFAFLSCEPLLGPIDLGKLQEGLPVNAWLTWLDGLDWVITGGETDQGGHKSRPTHPDWFRSLRDQCADAGVPFHHKQNGEWLAWGQIMADGTENYLSYGKQPDFFQQFDHEVFSKVKKSRSGRMLDGVTHDAFPQIGGAA